MFKTLYIATRDRKRIREIVSVLIHYGLASSLDRTGLKRFFRKVFTLPQHPALANPKRLCQALETLGPTFIKLGQLLASRHDLLPQEWVDALSHLQDHVAPTPWEDIEPTLRANLGSDYMDLFTEFSREPIASASIAQVYRARRNNESIIIKVIKPKLKAMIESDLRIVHYALSLALKEWPSLAVYAPYEQLRSLSESLLKELDLREEARHADFFRQTFSDTPSIRFPKIHWDLTTEHVMVQEDIKGTSPSTQFCQSLSEQTRKHFAKTLVEVYLHMVLSLGLFHADPHPGNLIVVNDNVLGLVDFGTVGKLSKLRRIQVMTLIHAVIEEDANALLNVLVEWSGSTHLDLMALESQANAFVTEHHQEQLKFDRILIDFMHIAKRNALTIPNDLVLLFKSLLLLDGTLQHFSRHFNLLKAAQPTISSLLVQNFSFDMVTKKMRSSGLGLLSLCSELPLLTRLFMIRLKQGRLTVEIDLKGIDPLTNGVERLALRVASALIFAALINHIEPVTYHIGSTALILVLCLLFIIALFPNVLRK